MSDEPSPSIPNHVFWFIWACLLFVVPVYLLVLQLNPPRLAEGESAPDKSFVRKVALVACANLLLSFAIRIFVTRRIARQGDSRKQAYLFPSCLFSWALAEAVAVYGLVLGLQGASVYDYAGFLIAGFSALVYLIPSFALPGDEATK